MRKIGKIISNAAKLESFILGLRHSEIYNVRVTYHDDENDMWLRGSLVRLKAVAALYARCIERNAKIWGLGRPDGTTTVDVYISDERCMLQFECYHREGESRTSKDVILLEYNFEKGYAVCDICDLSGIKYCYCVTLRGATNLLTNWCCVRYAGEYRLDRYFARSWECQKLVAEDILSGGPVLCGGAVRRISPQ